MRRRQITTLAFLSRKSGRQAADWGLISDEWFQYTRINVADYTKEAQCAADPSFLGRNSFLLVRSGPNHHDSRLLTIQPREDPRTT
jgi:hypothetical protein